MAFGPARLGKKMKHINLFCFGIFKALPLPGTLNPIGKSIDRQQGNIKIYSDQSNLDRR